MSCFSADDCFEIGLICINNNDYTNGLLWLEEFLIRTENVKNERADIVRAAFQYMIEGEAKEAFNIFTTIFEDLENEESFYQHIRLYKNAPGKIDIHQIVKTNLDDTDEYLSILYKSACRGEQYPVIDKITFHFFLKI